ncbi:hypothetical protein SAMN05421721_103141 [Ectothiorhodospira mobilis]|uniref:DUF7931 domain-containing protein n=1 Tax=Ectothiorhodospira mobilis TaxID=195064 RepID=A0A1I4Q4E8_ECTMO|nr:hypothetical protein [Ectothiorhodospira mobilis]SFM34951.1 hypothetical protein SAMN05421721_103141 [Ectothiorhodospira mobilis]
MSDPSPHPPLDTAILGKIRDDVPLEGSADLLAATLAMAAQARRSLQLVSRHLDPDLYDQGELVAECSRLARRSRYSEIRILIQDPEPLRGRTHGLIELAQRLSSRIQVMRMSEADRKTRVDAFLIADGVGCIHQPRGDRHQGTANFHAPRRSKLLMAEFQTLWDAAEPDPHLRRLYL